MSELAASFEAMLDRLFPLARARAIDSGGGWELERSGFLDMLVAGQDGGAGLRCSDALPLWFALGNRAAPLEIGHNMIARAAPADSRSARAVLLAAAMAGAAERVLAMTIVHANQRVQFGRPIGRQQAVQQQLAVMAEQVAAMRLSAELAASSGRWPTPVRAAAAKTVAALHAPAVANTAHAVHGAIGISAEHDLHLFTRRLHRWRLEEGGETLWARELGRALLGSPGSALDFLRAELFA